MVLVDCSGSMSKTKIMKIQASILTVLSFLGENDRFALISFNNKAKLLLGFKRCTEYCKKNLIERALLELVGSGCTNMV